jgi:hypothetical protein
MERLKQIIWRMYSSDPSPRTQILFLSLLRAMINKEIEACGGPNDLFISTKKRTSLVFELFSKHALSQRHYKDLVHAYLKYEKKRSEDASAGLNLMHLLKNHVESGDSFTMIFAMKKESYEKFFGDGQDID